ncbi:hypothetical protein [Peribacillus frigoritolerans]|uniref:hypothetical protein n=1 Tax=Peribacillus frigoritolerans TaxID=450367 RepID=UPI003D2E0954
MRRIIMFFTGLSIIFILIIKYFWVNTTEFWEYGQETGEIIFDLSVGYISAFIFYVLDIWIPEIKEKKKINKRLAIPLRRILNSLKQPIDEIIKKYSYDMETSFHDLSKVELDELVGKINLLGDEGYHHDMELNKPVSFLHSLTYNMIETNKYISQINELSAHLEIDLVEILDKIRNSNYHEHLELLNRVPTTVKILPGEVLDLSIYDYYLLFFELESFMKKK